jgi:hypothetical protein
VYGAVPPVGATLAEPLPPPLQDTFIKVDAVAPSEVGSATVAVAVVVQLCASVTITVYVPAGSPLAVAVVCAGEVLQL